MPNFDLKTIIFMSMLLTFMLSMMLAITRKHHKDLHGPAYWAVGNMVIGLGMVLVLMQLDALKAVFLPGIAFIGAGLSLYINGIQAFVGKKPNHHITPAVFLLLIAIEAYFMRYHYDVRMVVVLSAIIFCAIYLYCARLTFTRDEGVAGTLFWIVSSLYLLMAVLMLGRALFAMRIDVTLFDSFATWPINAYTFMLAAVSQFFISSLFVLMLSYKLNQKLESFATIDGLTGVLNRRGLEDAALKMQDICKRINLSMAILLIDIDYFKRVNDQYGHLCGDDVLRHLCKEIASVLRSSDVLGRYGGEEFCVFLPNTTEADAVALAERIRELIAAGHFVIGLKQIKLTVSIGVADSVRAGYEFKGLVAAADVALYGAKNSGRNRVMSYMQTKLDAEIEARL